MQILYFGVKTILTRETRRQAEHTGWKGLHGVGLDEDLGDEGHVVVVHLLLEFELRPRDVLGLQQPEGLTGRFPGRVPPLEVSHAGPESDSETQPRAPHMVITYEHPGG